MRKLICFLFLSSLAFGQGGAQSGEIIKSTAGLSGTVRVCTGTATGTPCSPLATIYSDAALTVPKTNPAASDIFGNYTYYAAPGNYEEQLSSGTSRFTRHVSIGINSSSVVGSFLPSVTGGDLGSTSKRWDLFAGAIDATSAAITTLTATTGTIATLNSTTATVGTHRLHNFDSWRGHGYLVRVKDYRLRSLRGSVRRRYRRCKD
jgi:outer membrane lipoprotein SlyB